MNRKIEVREALKGTPLYRRPLPPDLDWEGIDDAGNPIPVNTVGRLVFGVPGFQGIVIIPDEGEPRLLPGRGEVLLELAGLRWEEIYRWIMLAMEEVRHDT